MKLSPTNPCRNCIFKKSVVAVQRTLYALIMEIRLPPRTSRRLVIKIPSSHQKPAGYIPTITKSRPETYFLEENWAVSVFAFNIPKTHN